MGDRESRVMAEKRHLEAVGAVAYNKLPRLEADPSHVLAAGLCRSSVLPGHASGGHYSYQGTYFTYPLRCHESPELSAHWSPTKPYLPCTDGAVSQHLRPEKAHCMLYRQESEGLGTWVQNPGYEKRKDCLMGDMVAAQEKWANYSGHTDFIQQGWVQGFPMPPASQVPSLGGPPLVAPKPVYRNHVYCTDGGCNPKGSLASGTPAESLSKWPTNVEWTSGHMAKARYGSATAKKAPAAESGFLPSHQSWKDTVAAPAVFSPYRGTFKNLQVAPSASVADASYPAMCNRQKSVPEECAGSPCGKAWSKLPPPASPLAAPPGLIYQERSSACYSLPSYPLASHEQLLLYQQSIAPTEKQKALFALPACKSFNFPAGEDPQLLPRTCFPPAPQSYYPGHLESYFHRTLGSPPVTSPGLKTPRDHESQQNSRSKISSISACSVAEKAPCGSPLPGREGVRDRPGAEDIEKPASENVWCRQETAQPCAFQPCAFQPRHSERLSGCTEDNRQAQSAFCSPGTGQQEERPSGEERPSYAEKQSTLSSEDKKRDSGKPVQARACIVISDSPVASQDSSLKGDSLRTQISESSDPSVQHARQSPDKEPRDLKRTEAPPPPSSPPMPVIHNVFSLAPYRKYLEGSADSLHLPSSQGCPGEKPSPERSWQKAEEATAPRPPSDRSSTTPGVLPDRGKDVAYNAVAEGGRKDPGGSCMVKERESGGYAGFCENYRGCSKAPAPSRQDAAGCVSELAKDDHVLDLSLKTEGSADVPHTQRPAGKTEALERENGKREGESVTEGQAKGQEAKQDTGSPAVQPPQKNTSEEKSNFQSSAAFLYKKFKILKSHATGSGSVKQPDFSLFQSSSQIAALPNDFSLQRGSEQMATRQNCLPVWQSCQQVATRQNSLPVQQSCQQAATRQNGLPVQQSCQQAATRQNGLPVQQSCQQAATRQNSLPVQQSCQQAATRQNSLPVQQTCQKVVTRQNSLPAMHIAHEKTAKPNTQRFSRKCLKQSDAPKLLPPAAPAGSPASLPPSCESPTQQSSSKQYFTSLHASVCAVISNSVSTSSSELLREWQETVEPEGEPKAKVASSAKAKSSPKTPEAPKPSKGKRVWLAFEKVAGLLSQLQIQLETFVFTHHCPFPHVVRAGTIFIPIHMVKEKLFGNLPGASIDHVLQEHKVELRPTTLSEEKLLRELDLKTCTSRMLKLLALKQLPDIYPDLLDLHWQHCVKEQLGESAGEIRSRELEAAGVEGLEAAEESGCLQSATRALSLGVRGKRKQGRKCESTPRGEASGSSSETRRPFHTPTSQGPSSSSSSNSASKPAKGPPQGDAASVAVRPKRFPLPSGAKRRLFRASRFSGSLQLKLTDRVTRSTSKVLRLRKSVVRIKFQNALQERQGCPVLVGNKRQRLVLKCLQRKRTGARRAPRCRGYPELVGKRIRHLYKEKDKTEAWYRGVVLRVHKPHKDPLKTVYEVKYDSEPEWQYYLEILQDYKKGWLKVDE